MVDVPNLPGVPPLPSYGANTASLLQADLVATLGAVLPPPWGVFDSDSGQPIFIPNSVVAQALSPAIGAFSQVAALFGFQYAGPVFVSTINFEYGADSPISTYQQEAGAFQSYDKVQLPFDVKLRLACGGQPPQRQAFIARLEALRTTTQLVDIVTPERTFSSCNCTHIDFRRSAESGVSLIVADAWFEQVPVTATVSFGSTQLPGEAAQQSIGNVQPSSLSQLPQSLGQQIQTLASGFL